MKSRRLTSIPIAVACLAAAYFYFVADPVSSELMPKCPVKFFTGYDCPGCGSQRALHALLHGDFPAAWSFNPFMIVMLPVIGLYLIAAYTRIRIPRLYALLNSPAAILLLSVAIIAWTIGRNL